MCIFAFFCVFKLSFNHYHLYHNHDDQFWFSLLLSCSILQHPTSALACMQDLPWWSVLMIMMRMVIKTNDDHSRLYFCLGIWILLLTMRPCILHAGHANQNCPTLMGFCTFCAFNFYTGGSICALLISILFRYFFVC